MPVHHVLCIHGIGKHSKHWVTDADDGGKSFESQMRELWDKYTGTSRKGKFDERIKLHSVCYDDEFEKLFDSWQEQSEKLKAGLKLSPILLDQVQWYTDIIDRADAARSEAHWGYTHLMDLLLFVGLPTIQDRIVTHVGRQIIDRIAQRKPGDKVSLIAHSMGCAVSHKALQALYNEGVETPSGVQTLKGDFKFENITMVANTSYNLSRDRANHYSGVVRPSLTAGQGCCYTWINVNHKLDPVGQFKRFDPHTNPQWLDPKVEGRNWHRDVTLTRISSKSIHAINHYFRDPALHLPFFELAFDARFSDDERGKAVDTFIDATPEGKFKSLKAQLDLLDVSSEDSFKAFLEALNRFLESIRLFN